MSCWSASLAATTRHQIGNKARDDSAFWPGPRVRLWTTPSQALSRRTGHVGEAHKAVQVQPRFTDTVVVCMFGCVSSCRLYPVLYGLRPRHIYDCIVSCMYMYGTFSVATIALYSCTSKHRPLLVLRLRYYSIICTFQYALTLIRRRHYSLSPVSFNVGLVRCVMSSQNGTHTRRVSHSVIYIS